MSSQPQRERGLGLRSRVISFIMKKTVPFTIIVMMRDDMMMVERIWQHLLMGGGGKGAKSILTDQIDPRDLFRNQRCNK